MSVTIDPGSMVGAVMDARPETVAVFVRNRMHCPGCVMARFMTLAEAAESHGVSAAGLLAELEAARAMTGTAGGIPRYRPWSGPALLSAGFRPFFLISGLWAAAALSAWMAALGGHLVLSSAFDPVIWHAREMLFGFVMAAVAGFLLTAVPNWTGRMPLQGWSLCALAALFVAGRIAVAVRARSGPGPRR